MKLLLFSTCISLASCASFDASSISAVVPYQGGKIVIGDGRAAVKHGGYSLGFNLPTPSGKSPVE